MTKTDAERGSQTLRFDEATTGGLIQPQKMEFM